MLRHVDGRLAVVRCEVLYAAALEALGEDEHGENHRSRSQGFSRRRPPARRELRQLAAEVGVTDVRLRDNGSVVVHSDVPGIARSSN